MKEQSIYAVEYEALAIVAAESEQDAWSKIIGEKILAESKTFKGVKKLAKIELKEKNNERTN